YAWDVPTVTQKLLVISAQGSIRRISLQEIGEQRPFVYGKPPAPPRRGSLSASSSAAAAIAAQATRALVHYTMNIEVAASGPRQVLKLTSYAPETSLYAPQIYPTQPAASARITRSPTAQSSTTQSSQGTSATRKGSGDERFEVVGADEKTNVVFRFGLEGGIGVSMINKYASEILFATLSDVEFKFTDSTTNQTAKLTVKWIQIDNQIYGALYPIVLYPTTLGSVAMTGLASPPALQAVVVRSKDSSYGVEYFKYASVLAQELSLELDEDFLYALLDFVKFDVPGWNDDVEDEEKTGKNMVDSAIPEVKAFDDGLQLYFEFLHIQPFKLNISFMRTQRLDVGGDPTTTRYPTAASAAAGSANARTYQKNRPSITSYNSQLAMSGGNNEKTGEGVASNSGIVASGVSDFFYEPYQGFVMSDRPQDFGFGLARGTASLFKKTVFGMTDSFSKFTDSVSKGLSAATLDPQYQTERSLSRVRNKPKHAIYGVARGAESFAKSVGSGIAGVVMRPIEGAEQEGVGGFFKGVGKGLVGVVTKPMIGMFDLASNVTEGIRNTTTVFERDLDRQRLPRHVGRDGIITVYSSRESLGQAWMRELNKGAYAYDNYLAHLELPGSDMVVLLTYQRLVMFRRAKPDEAGMAVGAAGSSMETGSATGAIGVSAANASKAQVEWEQEIRSLHSIQLEATGISLKLPATPEGYVPPGPFIPISDGQSRRWFYNRIKEAVKALIDDSKEY
ncbi:Vacuolar protein sorting-associated protein 13, partial [Dipsacomyces acuminosporus]